ncbi:phosphate ABC transporter permease [Bacillus sp. AFS018417]|uniref:phosphate ABC transporter permease n=1 Tax=Bacillus sp. AFS018417 TaxID=2033491 RepID=UPI000BF7A1B1|nr:phosphate ABC transporter permease [Bacillus sp. AFS018417]PEZ06330.1 phosphate ABC transporter permease [Bacillus sp. AFS018417]
MLFSHELEIIYLYGFIITTFITVIYLFFSDVFESLFHIVGGPTSPVTILFSFLAMFCGFGYIFEYMLSWGSIFIFVVAFFLALVGVITMKMLILAPISKAEQNTMHRMEEFIGCKGEVIITIPKEGLGEVLLVSQFGSNAMPAKTIGKKDILQGSYVIVEAVQDGVLLVQNLAMSLKKPK